MSKTAIHPSLVLASGEFRLAGALSSLAGHVVAIPLRRCAAMVFPHLHGVHSEYCLYSILYQALQ